MDPLQPPPEHLSRARAVLNVTAAVAPPATCCCQVCSDLIPAGYRRCARCRPGATQLTSLTPIALASSGGPLHGLLRGYKDDRELPERDRLTADLTSVLWTFLDLHQHCAANAAGADAFDVLTTVPSANATRDAARPRLRDAARTIYGQHAQLLRPTGSRVTAARVVDPSLYDVTAEVVGAAVLLVDDTWVTGSRMRSAAHALMKAGAAEVAGVVIGRQVSANYRDNADRLAALPTADLERCTYCSRRHAAQASSAHQASTSLR